MESESHVLDNNYDGRFRKLLSDIDILISFLKEQEAIIQSHLNDFILKDLGKLVPSGSGQVDEELYMRCQDLGSIHCCYNFQRDCCHNYCTTKEKSDKMKVYAKQNSCQEEKINKNTFLSVKKTHETTLLSSSISRMSDHIRCKNIVDIGSGKGYLGQYLSGIGLDVLGIEGSSECLVSAEQRQNQMKKLYSSTMATVQCKTINFEINVDSLNNSGNFVNMINENFIKENTVGAEEVSGAVLVGLHACGDLTSNALKLFSKESYFKGLQIVGCCYNLCTEMCHGKSYPGFPISEYLMSKQFTLGKNARMLACQCPEKWRDTKQVLQKSLLYRAILEKILLDKGISKDVLINVKFRGIGKKSKSFGEYVSRVLQNIPANGLEITPAEAEFYYKLYEGVWVDMQRFHWQRMQLAPCIEKLILFDRLCYLLESGFPNAAIVKIFLPTVSPRCFALICDKLGT